jgi:hypothetical protein
MAEIWAVGLATLAVGAYSANQAGNAAEDAANKANQGTQAGINEQKRQFDQFQTNINPYLEMGKTSIGGLNALNSGDYSGFENSPDYLYAQQAGTQRLDAGAAAHGNLWGGGADADRIALGQGLATQYMGNYRNALQYGATLGQNSAVGAGQLGQQNANSIAGAYGAMGQNSGNAGIANANAWGNFAGQAANLGGQYMASRQSSYQVPQTGTADYGAFNPNQNYYANSTLGSGYGQGWGG